MFLFPAGALHDNRCGVFEFEAFNIPSESVSADIQVDGPSSDLLLLDTLWNDLNETSDISWKGRNGNWRPQS